VVNLDQLRLHNLVAHRRSLERSAAEDCRLVPLKGLQTEEALLQAWIERWQYEGLV
jgi:hypothetical protein